MSDLIRGPVEILQRYGLSEARAPLDWIEDFTAVMETVGHNGQVNDAVKDLGRADLILMERSDLPQLTEINDVLRVRGDFAGRACRFGKIITDYVPASTKHSTGIEITGHEPFTKQELAALLTIGRPTNPKDLPVKSESAGIPQEIYRRTLERTHLGHPAFARMCAVAPSLSTLLMERCLIQDTKQKHQKLHVTPEIFAVHTIMSRLVDTTDEAVARHKLSLHAHR